MEQEGWAPGLMCGGDLSRLGSQASFWKPPLAGQNGCRSEGETGFEKKAHVPKRGGMRFPCHGSQELGKRGRPALLPGHPEC